MNSDQLKENSKNEKIEFQIIFSDGSSLKRLEFLQEWMNKRQVDVKISKTRDQSDKNTLGLELVDGLNIVIVSQVLIVFIKAFFDYLKAVKPPMDFVMKNSKGAEIEFRNIRNISLLELVKLIRDLLKENEEDKNVKP